MSSRQGVNGRFGLVINPVAGIGGPAGLKGSDGAGTQRLARAAGVSPQASARAVRMLQVLAAEHPGLPVLTAAGPMGADAVAAAGLEPVVVHTPAAGTTTAVDTLAAVEAAIGSGAGLVAFVGGDGTARDVATAAGDQIPVLGVPAGVKMYSSAFAVSPEAAGFLASRWLTGRIGTRSAEILDIDETALRAGTAAPQLHALVRIPEAVGRTQARKAPTPASEAAATAAAARGVIRRLLPGVRYLLGPGGTTAEVARQLGLLPSPLGVDVVGDGGMLASDADESRLLAEVDRGAAKAVVTVIGGQGFILGRGNQQLSARVLRAIGSDPLLVVATEQKLLDLVGRPLLVDTGDPALDRELSGPIRVITGPATMAMYPAAAAHDQ
ncbi:MAG: ATP-NAD kinase family protein [Propioniciclava sp.]